MGIPEMAALWADLKEKATRGNAKRDELKLYKTLGKALKLLAERKAAPLPLLALHPSLMAITKEAV